MIPFDETVTAAELEGRAVLEYDLLARSMRAVALLLTKLRPCGAVKWFPGISQPKVAPG